MFREFFAASFFVLALLSTANAQVDLYEDGKHLGSVAIPDPDPAHPYVYKCYRANVHDPADSNEFFNLHDDKATSARIRHKGGPCRILFYERDSGSKDEHWLEINLHKDCPEGTVEISLKEPGIKRFPVNSADGKTLVGDGFYHVQRGGDPIFHDLSRIEIYRYK